MRGIFKKVTDKGFGFIEGEDGTDYFVHKSSFRGKWFALMEEVEEGKKVPVEFDTDEGPKGPRADNVRRLTYAD